MLNDKEMDIVPSYLYLRDVVKEPARFNDMTSLKSNLIHSPLVKRVTDVQWDDGSWGSFHSLSMTIAKTTTEIALRRLYYLGLDKSDDSIIRAINYMESFLKGEICLRDRVEKKHDWKLLTTLFVSTWILRYDCKNEMALSIATKWANTINESFVRGQFDSNLYRKAYLHYLKPETGKHVWQVENFYVVSIVRGLLDSSIEKDFLKYIINYGSGIYYMYDKPLCEIPDISNARNFVRYLMTLDFLLDYESAKELLVPNIKSIISSQNSMGEWDLGSQANNKVLFPFSNSWKSSQNRIIDSTLFILRILTKAK